MKVGATLVGFCLKKAFIKATTSVKDFHQLDALTPPTIILNSFSICFSSPSVNKGSCCANFLSRINDFSAFYRLFIRSYLQYKFYGLVVCDARTQFLHAASKIGTAYPLLLPKSSNFASISRDKLCTNVHLPFLKIFLDAIMMAY